jgi:hypothetical protein
MILPSYNITTGQHLSQGNQRCRGSTVEAREVITEERLRPEDFLNAQVIGDPIAELQQKYKPESNIA